MRSNNPDQSWWSIENGDAMSELEPRFNDVFERRRAEQYRTQLRGQTPDNPIHQNRGFEVRNVAVDEAHRVPDVFWELGLEWDVRFS